jgi:hypothetical protein
VKSLGRQVPHRRPRAPPFIVARRRPRSTWVVALGCCAVVVVKGDVYEPYSGMALVLAFELCSSMVDEMALVLLSVLYSGMADGMTLILVSSFG